MTAALALLLAFLFHLGLAAVVVAILGGLPSAVLAWAALSGAKKETGKASTGLEPAELGVHQVIGGPPTAYVRRPHDGLLRVVLDPPVAASRLVVVRGGSSTGKTRAVYEAVKDQRADWRLDYPKDPDALTEHLNAGIPARTVLWLGDLIVGKGLLLVTAVWHE